MGEKFVETNGVRLWCETLGDPTAPWVVLISGAYLSAMWWYPEFLDGLTERGWQVVRFDNRDVGLSTHVDFSTQPYTQPYTVSDMVTDTAGVLENLGIDRAHFMGISLGGMIAQLYALHYPERVDSLTLNSTSPGPSDPRLSPPSAILGEIAMRVVTTPEQRDQRLVDLLRAIAGSRFPFDEAEVRRTIAIDNARGTNPNWTHGLVAGAAPSWLDDLSVITTPTLIIHGTEDPMFPIDHGEALSTAILGAEMIRWEGVGHELPRQLVSEQLARMDMHLRSA
jgi:pimeloyl-ACP methyl ester carboxylesterase